MSERYTTVWLNPAGSRDTVSLRIVPVLAPARTFAIGAAYDNDLGGRIWLGQVSRHVGRSNLEIASAAMLGELRQEVFAALRIGSATGYRLTPLVELRASRELVRRFQGGDVLTPLKVHEGVGFAGVALAWRGNWQGSLGLEGRLWDAPGRRGQGSVGPRFSVQKSGDLAEPLLQIDAEANAGYRRLEMEGIATIRLGRLVLRPRLRTGWGDSLPEQRRLALGGDDGLAGRHIGEMRGERELFGSLVFLYPLKGSLMARLEPMLGAVGGNAGFFPDGEVHAGVRMGINLFTGLGPIRVEYGVSGGGRDALLVRLGRWF
jgi:hypothetical protein